MKNVVILDWWDRLPCTWICDLDKLDENDPIQKKYKDLILLGLDDACISPGDDDGLSEWYMTGNVSIDDVNKEISWGGRPEEVDHAKVYPPCQIEGVITLWYGD